MSVSALRPPNVFLRKCDTLADTLDKHLVTAEDVARVPEGMLIPFKVLIPQSSKASLPITSITDSLGMFRGGVSSLRVTTMSWNVIRGRILQGGFISVVFNVILAATRALVLVSFLDRNKAITLPQNHATGINFSISAGFTILSVMSFVNSLRIWQSAQSTDGYNKAFAELSKKYKALENSGAPAKTRLEIHNEVLRQIQQKGHDAGSEFLEALITPLDTGACNHNSSPYLVVPLAIIGGISAGIRLWRSYSN